MPVDKRFGDIQNLMKKIYFDGGKATMKAFGLNIREQPVDVTAICRPLPQPVYADGAKPAVDVKVTSGYSKQEHLYSGRMEDW